MKYVQVLTKLAERISNKYALDGATIKQEVQQAVQTAVGNASGNSQSGIMPFMQMIQADGSQLSFDVTRSGDQINVSPIQVTPGSNAPKYSALTQQVQSYLERYLQVYPTYRNGEAVEYPSLTVTLQYTGPQQTAGNKLANK